MKIKQRVVFYMMKQHSFFLEEMMYIFKVSLMSARQRKKTIIHIVIRVRVKALSTLKKYLMLPHVF